MAIIGAGSDWDSRELKKTFFEDSNYPIGWGIADARDLYAVISIVKVGGIIYFPKTLLAIGLMVGIRSI